MVCNGVVIHDNERIDDLHRNGYKIIQDPKLFCFGVDAVLLSGFAKVRRGETVLDLGTGTGIIPILLEARNRFGSYIGLEIQEESAEMAERSVKLNGLSEKITIQKGDIKNMTEYFKPSSFDVITANPPYINEGAGLLNDYTPKAVARHEILCSLSDIISGSSKLLCTGGRFYLIHRPHRLSDIFTELRNNKLEPKVLRFIHPYIGKEPTMLLIEAVRSGKPFLKVLPPLIIYKENGEYTEEVCNIYYSDIIK